MSWIGSPSSSAASSSDAGSPSEWPRAGPTDPALTAYNAPAWTPLHARKSEKGSEPWKSNLLISVGFNGVDQGRERFDQISYAESVMEIVQHYGLDDIGGEETPGANGHVNPSTLPAGYPVIWRGTKVLKHDGSRHHGGGIQPTLPASRTIAGVAGGRHELLERALAVLRDGR